jgi:SAM-dependent methyltransferase
MSPKLTSDAEIGKGHYATKQIFCKDRLIAWSHRRRFEIGIRLARRFHGKRILDYGCGDGTFLALLHATDMPPAESVGAELDDFQVNDCRERFGQRPGLRFERIASLDTESHRGAYDGVICMEVLEHIVALDAVIDRLWRVLADEGTLIVSVPVETGLPLLVKQNVRRIAGWRGIGDYPGTSPYTLHECCASVFAGRQPHLTRTAHVGGDAPFYDHKGFNWMALRTRLCQCFDVQQTVASPVPWLGPHLATQVWFVATKKRTPAS